MPLVWTDDLDTGVESMNAEHKVLIDKMNHLEALDGEGTPTELATAFQELIDYTKHHFRSEEAYMAKLGFDRLDTHKKAHGRVLAKLDEYGRLFQAGQNKLPFGLVDFLSHWLRSHINVIDKRYGDFANR